MCVRNLLHQALVLAVMLHLPFSLTNAGESELTNHILKQDFLLAPIFVSSSHLYVKFLQIEIRDV